MGGGFLRSYGILCFVDRLLDIFVFCWSFLWWKWYIWQFLLEKIYLIYTLLVKTDLDDIYILHSLWWIRYFAVLFVVFLWYVQIWMSTSRFLMQYASFDECSETLCMTFWMDIIWFSKSIIIFCNSINGHSSVNDSGSFDKCNFVYK